MYTHPPPMLGKMKLFSEGPYSSLLTLRSACFSRAHISLQLLWKEHSQPAEVEMVARCEVLSFHTDSDFCAAYQSYMTNQQELSENDDILHLLPNPFPEKCYNTVEIFTSIFPNCSFCCNFQSWFPDIISVVISRPRENFPVTVSSVPHTSLQPL